MLSVTAVLLGLGIHKYQDQIQELGSHAAQATQLIKDAFGVLSLHLGEAKNKILVAFSSTADVQEDIGDSTSGTSTPSFLDRIKDFIQPYLGNAEVPDTEVPNAEPESGE